MATKVYMDSSPKSLGGSGGRSASRSLGSGGKSKLVSGDKTLGGKGGRNASGTVGTGGATNSFAGPTATGGGAISYREVDITNDMGEIQPSVLQSLGVNLNDIQSVLENLFQKYKFAEDFINPKTNMPYGQTEDSPKTCEVEPFGTFEGHRIQRIKWAIRLADKEEIETTDDEGNIILDTTAMQNARTESGYELVEKPGELGGYIERYENLSQRGDCWVEDGGYVWGQAYVYGDAKVLSGGRVFGEGKAGGKARIVSGAVGGSGHVYGNGRVNGDESKVLVSGFAEVEGTVSGKNGVSGRAHVYEGGVVDGKAYGRAEIFGEVGGTGLAADDSLVVGKVTGAAMEHSYVGVKGFVEGSGSEDNPKRSVAAGGAIVLGAVKGESAAGDGQPMIEPNGAVDGNSSASGNVAVNGEVKAKSEIRDNAKAWELSELTNSIMSDNGETFYDGGIENSTVVDNAAVESTATDVRLLGNIIVGNMISQSTCDGNGWINGTVKDCTINGSGMYSTVWKSVTIGDPIVEDELSKNEIGDVDSLSDSSIIRAKMTGTTLYPSASLVDVSDDNESDDGFAGQIEKNSHVVVEGVGAKGTFSANGMADIDNGKATAGGNGIAFSPCASVKDNAIVDCDGASGTNNQVVLWQAKTGEESGGNSNDGDETYLGYDVVARIEKGGRSGIEDDLEQGQFEGQEEEEDDFDADSFDWDDGYDFGYDESVGDGGGVWDDEGMD